MGQGNASNDENVALSPSVGRHREQAVSAAGRIRSYANRRLAVATIDVDTGRERQISELGTMPAAFDLAENFNEFPYRGFSLHRDGTSFLTSILRAKMQLYLMKDFERDGRLADRLWRQRE